MIFITLKFDIVAKSLKAAWLMVDKVSSLIEELFK